LAAASVIAVAAASAGIATALSSHHGPAPATGNNVGSSASPSTAPASASHPPSPQSTPAGSASTGPVRPPEQIPGAPWSAALIYRQAFTPDSLVGGQNSLYAMAPGHLDRIDPSTDVVAASVPYNSPIPGYPNQPVIAGNAVWLLSSYNGTSVVLTGYDATTLAQVASVSVPTSGQVSGAPRGVLAADSSGDVFVAAGSAVAEVNSTTHQVTKRIPAPGPVNSLAVWPGGGKLAVSTGAFDLTVYNADGARLKSSSLGIGGPGGNLVATSSGVWGTFGVGMTERIWFAPNADLTQIIFVTQAPGAGLYTVPSSSGGLSLWIGGSQRLLCADPNTGKVLASANIPTDNGVVEYFGSVAATGGQAYALYQNQAAQRTGIARLTPPAACGGWTAYSPGS
jgi:hypothetical protein